MGLNYNKLWKILIDKKLRKTDLIKMAGISTNVLSHLSHDESISLNSIEKICKALNCNIENIVTITEDESEHKKNI